MTISILKFTLQINKIEFDTDDIHLHYVGHLADAVIHSDAQKCFEVTINEYSNASSTIASFPTTQEN